MDDVGDVAAVDTATWVISGGRRCDTPERAQALAEIAEAVYGLVNWRTIDYARWLVSTHGPLYSDGEIPSRGTCEALRDLMKMRNGYYPSPEQFQEYLRANGGREVTADA
jgi:hypothetical protein